MSWQHENKRFVDTYQGTRATIAEDFEMDTTAPVVSRGGKSFDWLGSRWRCEGGDPEAVALVVAGIMAAYYPDQPVVVNGYGTVEAPT